MTNDPSKGIAAPDEDMPEVENATVPKTSYKAPEPTVVNCKTTSCSTVEEPVEEMNAEPKRLFRERWNDFWGAVAIRSSNFYHNWLVPKLPLISKCFLSLCGVMFIVLVLLGLYKMYELSTLLGIVVTLMVLVWLVKIGRKTIGEILYKALHSTIVLLTSFKDSIDNKKTERE